MHISGSGLQKLADAPVPDSFLRKRVFVELDNIPKWQFGGQPFAIQVYVVEKDTAKKAASATGHGWGDDVRRALHPDSPNYAGFSAVFSSMMQSPCANCARTQNVADRVRLVLLRSCILAGALNPASHCTTLLDVELVLLTAAQRSALIFRCSIDHYGLNVATAPGVRCGC